MNEPTFRNLFGDLLIFFGAIATFVGGFLAFSYFIPPAAPGLAFWTLFLAYIYLYAKGLRFVMDTVKRRRKQR